VDNVGEQGHWQHNESPWKPGNRGLEVLGGIYVGLLNVSQSRSFNSVGIPAAVGKSDCV
jgi:hypothetical protein